MTTLQNILQDVHPWIGYVTSVVLLVTALVAFKRAKDAREFNAGVFSAALGLLEFQFLLGIVLYAIGRYWEAAPELAYIHPALALLAVGLGRSMLGRAKKTQMAVEAHRKAGRALIFALVFTLLAVGVASAPPFLNG